MHQITQSSQMLPIINSNLQIQNIYSFEHQVTFLFVTKWIIYNDLIFNNNYNVQF